MTSKKQTRKAPGKRARTIRATSTNTPPLFGAAAFARLLTAVMLQNKLAKGKR